MSKNVIFVNNAIEKAVGMGGIGAKAILAATSKQPISTELLKVSVNDYARDMFTPPMLHEMLHLGFIDEVFGNKLSRSILG